MPRISITATTILALFTGLATAFLGVATARADGELSGTVEAVISVADQKMALLCDGGLIVKFPISTSRFGIGDSMGSYRTPLGHLKVCDKIGGDLPPGAVIKHRSATGEVLQVNAPGRDPIVSRIMWLEGLEEQNRNAKARSIYIHGTPEESKLGKNVSWGCVRMRTTDVIELYDTLPVGASVTIIQERLPHYSKYTPPPPPPPPAPIAPPPPLIAAHPPAKGAPQVAAAGPAKPGQPAAAPAPAPPAPAPPTHLVTNSWHPVRPLPEPIAALATPYDEQAPHFSSVKNANSLKGSILTYGLEESIAALRSSGNVPPPLPGKSSAPVKSAAQAATPRREAASAASPAPNPAPASPSTKSSLLDSPRPTESAAPDAPPQNLDGLALDSGKRPVVR